MKLKRLLSMVLPLVITFCMFNTSTFAKSSHELNENGSIEEFAPIEIKVGFPTDDISSNDNSRSWHDFNLVNSELTIMCEPWSNSYRWTIRTEIKNVGTSALDSIVVKYHINGIDFTREGTQINYYGRLPDIVFASGKTLNLSADMYFTEKGVTKVRHTEGSYTY